MTPASLWTASKPAAWRKLTAPGMLGLALALRTLQHPLGLADGSVVLLGLAWLVSFAIVIVLWNDIADESIDGLKRRMFPESSPKTLVDGLVARSHFVSAAKASALGFLVLTAALASLLKSLGPFVFAFLGVALFVSYSFPPLRMNYRGGGEVLEAIGTGLLIPFATASFLGASADMLVARDALLLSASFAFGLASAIASGLSDELSDRSGGKVTYVGLYGNRASRLSIEILFAVGATFASLSVTGPARWLLGAALSVTTILLLQRSPRAVTNAFAAQSRYKALLHRSHWTLLEAFAVVETAKHLSTT